MKIFFPFFKYTLLPLLPSFFMAKTPPNSNRLQLEKSLATHYNNRPIVNRPIIKKDHPIALRQFHNLYDQRHVLTTGLQTSKINFPMIYPYLTSRLNKRQHSPSRFGRPTIIPSPHLQKRLTYDQQVTTLCTIIEKVFNPQDNQPLSAYAQNLKSYDEVFKKHPDLEKLVAHLTNEPSLWSFLNTLNTIPEENYPPEIYTKIKKLSQALSGMNTLEKLKCIKRVNQKFKK